VVLIPWTSGSVFDEQVAWARAALNCPAILDLERSATAQLTAGQFLSNLRRALDHTRMRIPPDPETAYHRYCGPGIPSEVAMIRSSSSGSPRR
jgi:hypothetical protein